MRTAPNCGSHQLSAENRGSFCFVPSHNSIPPIFHIFPTANRVPYAPTSPICAADGAAATPHPRASAAAASRRRRTVHTRSAPAPVPVTASRGHPRWSLSPHQENRVGSISSSAQHRDDLELHFLAVMSPAIIVDRRYAPSSTTSLSLV